MIHSREREKDSLEVLRQTLADRAEMAYLARDAEGAGDLSKAYAAGEAHAYAIAEEQVRAAQREDP